MTISIWLEVGDGAAGGEDSGPEGEGGDGGGAGPPGGEGEDLPLVDAAVDGGVEDEGIEADEDEEEELHAEGGVGVVFCGLGPEEQEAADEHDDEAGPGEGEDGAGDAGDGEVAEGEAQHAEVEQGDG